MNADAMSTPSAAFENLLKERYSCRAFLPQQVDTAVITRMLEIAQRTPSWCNSQPWQVVITRGSATDRFRAALCEYAAAHEREPFMPPDEDVFLVLSPQAGSSCQAAKQGVLLLGGLPVLKYAGRLDASGPLTRSFVPPPLPPGWDGRGEANNDSESES